MSKAKSSTTIPNHYPALRHCPACGESIEIRAGIVTPIVNAAISLQLTRFGTLFQCHKCSKTMVLNYSANNFMSTEMAADSADTGEALYHDGEQRHALTERPVAAAALVSAQ